ncbi:mycofactocin biosynthesis chaperone MftB [Cumulibacter soli]|uniref:mycofactocin biosynthesis chaperone MftB n=1 Tax=Cumulibacter soli TaxID=2546344 RepID=UPI001067941C|nr:mycofactocin biosynthesis chaperone MftB [Cumulibacter soli]
MLDTSAAWALHPAVSVRPEPFGALLYHFGNRKLSFLKDRLLLDVVRAIDEQPSLDAAFQTCGVPKDQIPRYRTAVQTLVSSEIVVPREQTQNEPEETA